MGRETTQRGQPLSPTPPVLRLHLVVTDLLIGGTPRVVRDLADRLRPLGYDTRVTCLAPWGPVADEIAAAGVPVSAAGVTGPAQLPAAVRFVRSATADADVVYSLLVHANVVAALANAGRQTPLVQSIQTTQPRPRWHWAAQAWAARVARCVVVPSASVAAVATNRAMVPPERIVVIPNAVAAGSERRRTPNTGPWRVAFVGRLDPVKRVPDLVEAVARVPGVRLDVYGDGRERGAIAATICRLGVGERVTLHGAVASSADALANADTLVLPSEAEGFGLVLVEAMAAGVPVIGTDVPGIRDVIRHGHNGLLTPVADPARLAAAIVRLRQDTNLQDHLATGGRVTVASHYGWPSVLAAYDLVFRKAARRRIIATNV